MTRGGGEHFKIVWGKERIRRKACEAGWVGKLKRFRLWGKRRGSWGFCLPGAPLAVREVYPKSMELLS